MERITKNTKRMSDCKTGHSSNAYSDTSSHKTNRIPIIISVLTQVTFFLGTILAASTVSATINTDVVDQINITVPVSCTFSGTGQDSHNATINNGQYNSNVGETNMKAFCNDNGGFSIYAIGYTDNELGKNVLTNSTLGFTHDIVTGNATSGNTSNWAMKLATVTSPAPTYPIIIAGTTEDTLKEQGDPDYTAFQSVPSTYVKVAYRTASTDIGTNAEGSTLTSTYQAYISPTQAAGTYSGQVKYIMVHPYNTDAPLSPQITESGKICYYPNGGSVVGTMGCQTISTSATSATLLASNFSRNGYGFAGWSDAYDYATNQNAHFYGPQETIAFTAGQYSGNNPGLSLYAVWIPSVGSLQDVAKVAELCGTGTGSLAQAPNYGSGTATLTSVSALTDQRDNETYAIAKLADGNCWMIENLRLEAEATRGQTNQSLAQGYGASTTYGSFAGLANSENTGFSDTYSSNSLYSNDGSNNTVNIGTGDSPAYRMPRYNNLNTPVSAGSRPVNPTSDTFSNDNTTAGMYSYGNYYTWNAAIADTTYYSSGDHSTTSICPSGWRLPVGGASGEFATLVSAANFVKKFPINILVSGFINSSEVVNRGSSGNYWSSTANGDKVNTSYYFYINPSSTMPNVGGYRYLGFTIRCLSVTSP